jgi:large repetitive protein
MTGKIVDYYTQAHIQAPDQKADDAFYPYSRQVAEANPLARIREVSGPGVDFKAGSSQSLLTDFGRTAEANALLADLHLTEKAASYTLLTTRHPFDGHTRVATTQLFDLQGNLIALRRSTGETALTSTRHIAYASNGTKAVTTRQPNFYTHPEGLENDPYTATTSSDFLGRIQVSHDSDTNAQHHISDPAGRLCFKMDTEGANQHPHHILYWRYDALGRILEEGTLDQQWNWEQLQQEADGIVPRTNTSANWTRSYSYDMARNSVTTHLKGRLVEIATRGDGIIRESFAYDLTGNLVETVLGIEVGEIPITGARMVTRYEYDQQWTGHQNHLSV